MATTERTSLHKLLRVASPSTRNTQRTGVFGANHATGSATGTQQTSLKALALLALGRTNTLNKGAIEGGKPAQQTPVFDPTFVAQESDVRGRLIRIAEADLINVALLDSQDADDLVSLVSRDDNGLRGFLHCLHDDSLRVRGQCPPDETARTLCRSCGPVWIAPEVAALAPIIDGWPRVLGCAWCHVKNRQAMPRPAVNCGDCRHFVPDTVNPGAGMGRCGIDREPKASEPMHYPDASRECKTFKPMEARSCQQEECEKGQAASRAP